MAGPTMPKDENLVAMQIAGYADGRTLAVTGSSGRKALPDGATVVSMSCSDAIHAKFGDDTVTVATTDGDWDAYMLAGQEYCIPVPAGATHVAAIGGGSLKIMARI